MGQNRFFHLHRSNKITKDCKIKKSSTVLGIEDEFKDDGNDVDISAGAKKCIEEGLNRNTIRKYDKFLDNLQVPWLKTFLGGFVIDEGFRTLSSVATLAPLVGESRVTEETGLIIG